MFSKEARATLLVTVISLLLGYSWIAVRGQTPMWSAVNTTLFSFITGYGLLYLYERHFRVPLARLLRLEELPNGNISRLLLSYLRLCKSWTGLKKLLAILGADYIAYIVTQMVPMISGCLLIAGKKWEDLPAIVGPVFTASPLLSLGLSILIIIANKMCGVESPHRNEGRTA